MKLFVKHSKYLTVLFLSLIAVLNSCDRSVQENEQTAPSSEKTMILLDWLEANGDYVNNREEIPSLINPMDVYEMRDQNILVIDLRPEEDYSAGHIEHSINIRPPKVLDYFKNTIDPASFEKIVFVTSNGFVAGYVTAITRMLGFDNTFALRFGLSSWDRAIAEKYWLPNVSNKLVGKLDFEPYPKNKPGNLPTLAVNGTGGLEIAWERAAQLLENFTPEYLITVEEVLENQNDYYIINYWPEEKYMKNGHLPGAVQYEPEKSFRKNADLFTVPTDKTVVLYCYSGQHSNFMVAYLQMLGYDVKSLAYGANGFIFQVMADTETKPSRTFTEKWIHNLPLVKGGEITPAGNVNEIPTETVKVAGGC
jgi:rhodanese-related sulfurtransferase